MSQDINAENILQGFLDIVELFPIGEVGEMYISEVTLNLLLFNFYIHRKRTN